MSPVLEAGESSLSPSAEDSGFFSFTERSLARSQLYSCLSSSSSLPPSPAPLGSSPTLEQALLMSLGQEREELQHWADLYTTNTEPDYDLAELVRSLRIKTGRLPPPPPASPTSPSHIVASPRALSSHLPPSPSLPRLPALGWRLQDSKVAPPAHHAPPPCPPSTPLPDLCPPPSTWSGQLPLTRTQRSPAFSSKIFLGGVPWDVTEASLVQAFSQFGPIRIEWPGKDTSPSPPKGYVYIIFEYEQNIPLLLSQCSHDLSGGGSWYFRISSHRMRSKEVQIIPWSLADSNFLLCPQQHLDPRKTVFVGALHGMLNAEGLATIFQDLFGGVLYAAIDTDKHKYPIGSGRVTFDYQTSYMRAVAASFVEIKCQKFSKKVQVDPYLEDALCSSCLLKQGPYFCR